jgi:hypothetical protein
MGWQLPRIEVDGNICLRRPWPTQGYRADNVDDEYNAIRSFLYLYLSTILTWGQFNQVCKKSTASFDFEILYFERKLLMY